MSAPHQNRSTESPAATASRRPRGALHPAGGFTLIEVLVVVAIIALLVSILLPSLKRAREQAKAVACGVNMRTCHQGMFYYLEANKDFFPFLVVGKGEGKKETIYGLNPWEVMHIYIQKATPAVRSEPIRAKARGWNPSALNYYVEWYLCGSDKIPHLSSQLERKIPDGSLKQVQYQLSYAAARDVMGIEGTTKEGSQGMVATRQSQSIKAQGRMVLFAEIGDDVEDGRDPWELRDRNSEDNQIGFELRHLSGQNIVYLDGHTQFHKMLEQDLDSLGKRQCGLPNFPLAWVPNSKIDDYPEWTGRFINP